MDLSVYIAELLNKNGTVSIPRVGVLSRVRMRGYYNAEEGKLYPPYYQTNFEFKPETDDSLVKYLVSRANVSEQSAKYFIDKYLQNLLQQAEIGEALLGGLGWISKDGDKLHFRADKRMSATVATFGFSPVDLNAQLVAAEKELNEPFNQPEVPAPAATPAPQEVVPPAPPVQQVPEPVATVSHEPTPVPEPVIEAPEVIEPVQPVEVTPAIPVQETPASAVPPVEVPEVVNTPSQVSPLMRRSQNDTPRTPPATPEPPARVPQPEAAAPVPDQYPQPGKKEPAKQFYENPWLMALIVGAVVIAGLVMFYPRQGRVAGTERSQKDVVTPSTDSVKVTPSVAAPVLTTDTTAAPSTDSLKVDSAKTTISGMARATPLPASTEFAPEVETPAKAGKGKELTNPNNYRFVLIGGSYGTWELAREAAARYHAAGIDASAFENTGRTVKVALGYFATWPEGQEYRKALITQKKVLSWKLYMETLRKKAKK